MEDTNFDLINRHIANVVEINRKMNGGEGVGGRLVEELSGTRIELFTQLASLKKLVETINTLDLEYKKAGLGDYKDNLFMLTTQLQYALSVDGLWDFAKEAILLAVQNNSLLDSIMEDRRSGHANLEFFDDGSQKVNDNNFKGENWLIAYCLLALYLSNPTNLLRD